VGEKEMKGAYTAGSIGPPARLAHKIYLTQKGFSGSKKFHSFSFTYMHTFFFWKIGLTYMSTFSDAHDRKSQSLTQQYWEISTAKKCEEKKKIGT
jgi:hypothetical protein